MPNEIGGNWSSDVEHDGYVILYIDWLEYSGIVQVPRKIAIAIDVKEGDTAHEVRDRIVEEWDLAVSNGYTAQKVGSEEFKLSNFPASEHLRVVDADGIVQTLTAGGDPVETRVGGLTLQRTEV